MKSVDYKEGLHSRLSDVTYAKGLLNAAFEECMRDGQWQAFGLLLQDIVEAHGNKQAFARKIGISRQHLYRLFSGSANPTVATLVVVLSHLGFKLTIERALSGKRARKLRLRA